MARSVFVAGSMRSGTTLLGEALASADDAVGIGETTLVWTALAEDWPCACGARASACHVWSGVLADLDSAGLSGSDLRALQQAVLTEIRTRRLAHLVRARRRSGSSGSPRLDRLTGALRRLTDSVVARSGASIVVETTKFLPGLLLRTIAGPPDLSVVHVIRDPRGVAASNVKSLGRPVAPGDPFGRSVLGAAATWSVENVLLAGMSPAELPYRVVSYERLVTQPGEVLGELGDAFDLRWPSSTLAGQQLSVRHNHALVGNPLRLAPSPRSVHLDETWRHTLTPRQARVVAVGTALPWHIARALAERRTVSRV